MKHLFLPITVIAIFLVFSCSKEKQTEKMLYGEWEVTSFLHGANDLTQLYKDSCGCRLVFSEMRNLSDRCILTCPFNSWNFYFLDSLVISPWRNFQFYWTSWNISKDGTKIDWAFGNTQPDSIFRWGMYPLTIGKQSSSFYVNEVSKKNMQLQFTDSTNIPFNIRFSKIN